MSRFKTEYILHRKTKTNDKIIGIWKFETTSYRHLRSLVDDELLEIRKHQPKANVKWKNRYTAWIGYKNFNFYDFDPDVICFIETKTCE